MHWHAYGPWTGSPETYNTHAIRRPGRLNRDALVTPANRRIPADAYLPFHRRTVPPMRAKHYLLRTPEATFAHPEQAISWLIRTYCAHPPASSDTPLEARIPRTRAILDHGLDISWCYYTSRYSLTCYAVIACPPADLLCPGSVSPPARAAVPAPRHPHRPSPA